jgi:hypothetical protein
MSLVFNGAVLPMHRKIGITRDTESSFYIPTSTHVAVIENIEVSISYIL